MLLTWITKPFIHRDRFDADRVTHLLMGSGDRLLETSVAELELGRKLLLVRRSPSRSAQCGATPSEDQVLPELLASKGVTSEQYEWLPGTVEAGASFDKSVEAWLNQHPDATICVFVDALESGQLRRNIDRRFAAANSGRVIVYPLEPEGYRSEQWWRSRTGCKEFFGQFVHAAMCWFTDDSEVGNPYPTPQSYEDDFKSRLQSLGVVFDKGSTAAEISL